MTKGEPHWTHTFTHHIYSQRVRECHRNPRSKRIHSCTIFYIAHPPDSCFSFFPLRQRSCNLEINVWPTVVINRKNWEGKWGFMCKKKLYCESDESNMALRRLGSVKYYFMVPVSSHWMNVTMKRDTCTCFLFYNLAVAFTFVYSAS